MIRLKRRGLEDFENKKTILWITTRKKQILNEYIILQMNGTDIIFSALSSQPENLQIELQAEQQNEYEKEYLEADLVSRIRTRNPSTNNFTIKSTTNIDTRRNCEPLINQDEDIKKNTCKKTGTNLMKYFYLKRFIQRIRNNRTKLSNVNENHIKLINDNSSDSQVMIQILKLNNHQHFQIRNVTKLFRDSTLSSHEHPFLIWIREKYQQSRKSIYEILSKIPQVHPESLKKIVWDYFTIVFRLLLLILIPLEIAYNPQILFEKLLGLTVTIIIILIVDNILRLNTICYLSGQAVYDRWKIIQVNLNLQTISDFALIFLLIYFTKNEGNQFKYLVLLISLTQHYQINQTLQKSEESQYFTKKQKAFINLFKLIIYLIYVLHLFSCIWFFNSSLNQGNSWIIFKELDHQQWQLQYLEAFYFAIVTMLTIGYGDNIPKTWNEKIVAIFFILSACLWFSYSINAIGTIIKEINQHFMERSRKIRVINRYMHQRNIPFSLQYRIREYLTFRWKEEAEIDLQQEETLLNELSEELKQDLKKQANNVFFKHCDFLFKNFSLELQNSLSPFIKRKIIQPQNTFSIYTLSEVYQPHLCFVEQGQLQYQNILNVSLKSVQNQGQFLEVSEFIEENDNAQTFKAIGYVSLLVLSKSDFVSIIRQYPKDYQKYCNLKDQFVLQVNPKHLLFGQYCAACNINTHGLKECPNLSLSIDRELIVKRYQYSYDQHRRYTRRSKKRGKTSFSTRCDREIIEQFAIYFQNEQPKLVQNQLSKQLTQEQDFDDGKSDINDQSPINKTFHFKRQESIQLPRCSLQSGEAISIQKQINVNDSIVSSENTSIQNLKLSTRQQCMITTNKFMTAKLSKYKKMCSQQNQRIPLIDTDESLKIDMQDCIYQNIELLYNKIFNEETIIPIDRSIYDLQILYFSLKAQQGIEQFEVVKNFSSYMVNHNIENIILQIEQKYHTLLMKPITQLIRFMYYPYEFIMKFQKIKTQRLKLLNFYKKRSFKNLKQKPSKINDLVRKWETPRKSYRFSVIIPNDE
ncbi:unnamed protein product (macronuclear) [Paramecium tetraurelia]|uniref:Potassium channel domain-containing protein n=1 Tax=Paramecium tetraurelia TaxID=5888 RepID=A0BS39_PARTE|nr:uncharacterized protein GSPATT00031587001 [Paramecium tetraurelia]CAK61356.1 unnamed protein product [Paramecium tetraurelia]|eukprot:XP_001428754.1 hypothetical protein (macronuclear) [Paramecium tetraurelia strain d4-2]